MTEEKRITDVKVIRQFASKFNGQINGLYIMKFRGDDQIVLRNGTSFGIISFYLNEPVKKCVDNMRDDVAKELLAFLEKAGL